MTTVSLPPNGEVARLPRCCEQHDDWRTLAEHLIDEFTSLAAGDVLRELARAKAAAAAFGLDESEQIGVGELMARHQLMLAAGEVPEVARLDPERHVRAERTA
jgi:hypothetical protein